MLDFLYHGFPFMTLRQRILYGLRGPHCVVWCLQLILCAIFSLPFAFGLWVGEHYSLHTSVHNFNCPSFADCHQLPQRLADRHEWKESLGVPAERATTPAAAVAELEAGLQHADQLLADASGAAESHEQVAAMCRLSVQMHFAPTLNKSHHCQTQAKG